MSDHPHGQANAPKQGTSIGRGRRHYPGRWLKQVASEVRWHLFWAQLRPVLLLAALTVILEEGHHLEWLDGLALQVSTSWINPASDEPCCRSVVVTINEDLFESDSVSVKEPGFHGRSPLDHATLRTHLRSILEAFPEPCVVVLDFDLSRKLESARDSDLPEWDDLEKTLIAGLSDLGVPACGGGKREGRRTVILPQGSASGSVRHDTQRGWESALATQATKPPGENKVIVAPATLLVGYAFNTVFRVYLGECDFAGVIRREATVTSRDDEDTHCKSVSEGTGEPATGLINFADASKVTAVCGLGVGHNAAQCRHSLAPDQKIVPGTVLFVGGYYGKSDRYRTSAYPTGDVQMPGVLLHAFGYATSRYSLQENRTFGVAVDIALGILLGMVFELLWTGFHRPRCHPECRMEVLLSLALVGVVLAAACVAVCLLAGRSMSHGIWVNPLPVIAGISVHAFVAAVHREAGTHADSWRNILGWPHRGERGWDMLLGAFVGCFAYLGILLWAGFQEAGFLVIGLILFGIRVSACYLARKEGLRS